MATDKKPDMLVDTAPRNSEDEPAPHSHLTRDDASDPEVFSPPAKAISTKQLLLAIVLVAGFAELAYTVLTVSAMPVFIRSIDLDDKWIGIIGTAFILVEGVMKSPFGLLGDRIGRRTLILAGPCVSIVTTLIVPHVHDPYSLIGLRVLDGLGAAALWPAAFSLIGDHVPEEKRSSAMSYFNLAYIVGIALGPFIGGSVNDFAFNHLHASLNGSKQASFYVASALFLMTGIVAYFAIPRTPPHVSTSELGGTSETEGGIDLHSFKLMLRQMPMTLLMTLITFTGIGLIMLYFKVFTLDTLHISETGFGKLLIFPALLIGLLSVPLGKMGDRIGKALAVKVGIGICAISFWLLVIFFNEITLIIFGSLLGIGFVIAFPAWMALVTSTTSEKHRGAAVGAVGTAQGIGAIIGVLVSSRLYTHPGIFLHHLPKHNLPFLGCALMLTISFVLAVTTVRDPGVPVDV